MQWTVSVTSSMQLSPPWEVATYSATQEFTNSLCNSNVYCRVPKSRLLVASWRRSIQSIHLHRVSLRSILLLYPHLRLGFLSLLFSECILHALLISLYHSDYIWRRLQVMSISIMKFSTTSNHFIPRWSKNPPQHPVLKYLPLVSEFKSVIRIQFAVNFLIIKFWFVTLVTKYLNFSAFSNDVLTIFM
jgi:hypothetical protein